MTAQRAFVGLVVAAGTCVLAQALLRLPHHPTGYVWLPFALLTWMSAPLALKVPGARLTITVSETLSLAIVFGFGWEAAAVTLAVDGLVTSLRQPTRRLDRTLFNVAEPALSIVACGLVLDLLTDLPPTARMGAPLSRLLVPGAIGATVYLLLYGVLTTCTLALETRANVWKT